MNAIIIRKPTKHKSQCLICKRNIEKGELVINVQQCMYPGIRTRYICNCVKEKL